ncbi:REP-associated tyrosine transposase [Acetobacterium tundrae]|uniref:Transposase n=1 Tax=Acetobacterium tundrae TaxID=132932 RepID=A0ABR6WPR9_9FIRM|nr:transposase [Acetobacterium tundrae]MBC3798412.1 transposase [Acetobacterium tundrae]
MARQARKKSTTGIYHVMLKGLDGRNIFLDDTDRSIFMEKLNKARETGGFQLYAYCLMDNHVHLLIKEGEELGTSIKRMTVGYVQLHNNKYGRTGHLFQNRFNSEAVEDDQYLMTVIRYIHRNPLKAGMVSRLKEYSWSSYQQIIQAYQGNSSIIDMGIIKDYFPTIADFIRFSEEENQDECLEINLKTRCSDEQLTVLLSKNPEYRNLGELSVDKRNQLIRQIQQETSGSIRQLSRVLGLGKMMVELALKRRA